MVADSVRTASTHITHTCRYSSHTSKQCARVHAACMCTDVHMSCMYLYHMYVYDVYVRLCWLMWGLWCEFAPCLPFSGERVCVCVYIYICIYICLPFSGERVCVYIYMSYVCICYIYMYMCLPFSGERVWGPFVWQLRMKLSTKAPEVLFLSVLLVV